MSQPPTPSRPKPWLLALVGVSLLAVPALLMRRYVPDVDALVALLHTLGGWPIALYIPIYAVATLLMTPLSVMILSGGLILSYRGIPVVLGGTVLGAAIAFVLGRGLLRGWVDSLIARSRRLRALQRALMKDGFRLTALLRMSPVMPFALYNYAAGVTPIGLIRYSLATFLGLLPRVSLGVIVGSGGRAVLDAGSLDALGTEQYVGWAFGVFATLAVSLALGRLAQRAIALAEEEGASSAGETRPGPE